MNRKRIPIGSFLFIHTLLILSWFTSSCQTSTPTRTISVETATLTGDTFHLSLGERKIAITADTPDQGNLSSIFAKTLNLEGGKLMIVEDANDKYLPEIQYISSSTPDSIRILLKPVTSFAYNIHSIQTVDFNLLATEKIGQSPFDRINTFLESITEEKIALILTIPGGVSSETEMTVYSTPISGLFYVEALESVGQTGNIASVIVTFDEPNFPSLMEILDAQNVNVDRANLIGLLPEDIIDLQFRAGYLPQETVKLESKFGSTELEKVITEAQARNLYRYINSVSILNSPCGSPEYEGRIFAMDPVPGKSVIPIKEPNVLYYCQELSKEDIKIVNLGFSGSTPACTFSADTKKFDVMLVMDVSGSMQGTKLAVAKASAIEFIKRQNPEKLRIGLVSFTRKGTLHNYPTNDYDQIIDIITNFTASGGTSIDAGLDTGFSALKDKGDTGSLPIIILLSDGQSEFEAAVQMADKIKAENVTILTLGIGNANQGLLSSIASSPEDFIFSNTTQGLREIFATTAQRLVSGGNIVARNLSMRFEVNTRNYSLIDSMLTNNGKIIAFGVVEWQIPVVYEGQELKIPLILRPNNQEGLPYGKLRISYEQCADGSKVEVPPSEISAGEISNDKGAYWEHEPIKASTSKTGSLDVFGSAGWIMDVQQAGIYSIVVQGSGSELAPEIYIGNGKEYLYPIYSSSSEIGKVSVFYIRQPKVYWLFLQSNGLKDSGQYSVNMVAGEAMSPLPFLMDGVSLSAKINPSEEFVNEVESIQENEIITVILSSEDSTPYLELVSLDGEYSHELYSISGDISTYVFLVKGKGPYRLITSTDSDEASTFQIEMSHGDTLGKLRGEIIAGNGIEDIVKPQQVSLWQFRGKTGEGISLALIIRNPQEFQGITYSVFDPDWEMVAWLDVEDQNSSLIRLSKNGIYHIAMQYDDNDVDKDSKIELGLEQIVAPIGAMGTITSGETVAGNLIQNQEDKWSFISKQNDIVTVKVVSNDPEAYIYIRVIDPMGKPYLFTSGFSGKVQLGPIRMSDDGEFTITVNGVATSNTTYQLTLLTEK